MEKSQELTTVCMLKGRFNGEERGGEERGYSKGKK